MIVDPAVAHSARQASKRSWLDRWMALLRRIGNVQAWIILSLFYVVILSPFGFIFRFAADPLRLRRRGSIPRLASLARDRGERGQEPSRTTTWQPFARPYDTLAEAKEQS